MKVSMKYIEKLAAELCKLSKKSVSVNIETWSFYHESNKSVETKTGFRIAIVGNTCKHHDFSNISSAIDFLSDQIKEHKKEKAA